MLARRVGLVPDDVVVDLAAAEDEATHGLLLGARIVDHGLERAVGELGERRARVLQSQQALRRDDDERAGDRVERLPTQEVEVLRCRRAVDDPQILLGAELQEPLEPRARVLWPVAFVPVRQQQRQTRRLAPLRHGGRDELVDHDLSAVREVAVLRLPEHERLRSGDRVAVLEAHARVLGERRVVDLERRRGARRDAASACTARRCARRGARGGAARTCRAARPGPSAARGCRRRAATRTRASPHAPSRCRPPSTAVAPPLELARELRMDGELLRRREQCLVELHEPVGGDRRDRLGAASSAGSRRRAPRSAARRTTPSTGRAHARNIPSTSETKAAASSGVSTPSSISCCFVELAHRSDAR